MAHLPPLREAPSPPRDNSSPRQLPHRLLDGGAVVSAFGLNTRSFKFSSAPSVLEAGSLHPDSTPRSSQVLTCQWCGQRVLLCIHCPVLILRVPCPLDCRVLFLTVLCPRKPLSPAQSRTACHPPPMPPHVSPDLGPPLVSPGAQTVLESTWSPNHLCASTWTQKDLMPSQLNKQCAPVSKPLFWERDHHLQLLLGS